MVFTDVVVFGCQEIGGNGWNWKGESALAIIDVCEIPLTGTKVLDDQHVYLANLVTEFYSSMLKCSSFEAEESLTNTFVTDFCEGLDDHLDQEEKHISNYDVPFALARRQDHNSLVQQLNNFSGPNFSSGYSFDVFELAIKCLTYHFKLSSEKREALS
jgi:hemerythrin